MKIGVVGAGTMGSGIAFIAAVEGFSVVIHEPTQQLLETAKERFARLIDRYARRFRRDPEDLWRRWDFTTDLHPFADCQVIIEAVPENLALKQEVFARLDTLTVPETLLATNTSSLPVTQIAAVTKNPKRVLGLHFFNPAPIMPLVEVIPALQTEEVFVQKAFEFCDRLAKKPVKVADSPGFVVTRVLYAYLNEAIWCLQEGIATIEAIDEAAKDFGMPMGAFALADLIGLDVLRQIGSVMEDAFGNRLKPAPLTEEMVARNWSGRKTGKGFWDYTTRQPNPELLPLLPKPKAPDPKGAFERMMLAMVKEAFLCWQEGVATPDDIDTAMRLGTNFPEEKGGGPLHYAQRVGLPSLLTAFDRWRKKLGDRFLAPYRLRLLATANLPVFH